MSKSKKSKSDLTEFLGVVKQKKELQKELDRMDVHERMWCLTQGRSEQVTDQLIDNAEKANMINRELGPLGDLAVRDEDKVRDGAALFNEYRELLTEDDYDGDGAAYWISSHYLDFLYKKKRADGLYGRKGDA